MEQLVGAEQRDQQDHGEKKKAVPDVIEDVVPGFVAKNKKCFLRSHFLEHIVVNNHAF